MQIISLWASHVRRLARPFSSTTEPICTKLKECFLDVLGGHLGREAVCVFFPLPPPPSFPSRFVFGVFMYCRLYCFCFFYCLSLRCGKKNNRMVVLVLKEFFFFLSKIGDVLGWGRIDGRFQMLRFLGFFLHKFRCVC